MFIWTKKNPKQTKNMSFKIPYKIKMELYGKLSCKKIGTNRRYTP